MRRVTLFLFFAITAALQAQGPKVGAVEIFGLRRVSAEKVRKALGVVEGGNLPSSKTEAEERIESIDGIVRANLEAVCCEDGRAILYVGVEERGSAHFEPRPAPMKEIRLPEEIMAAWMDFVTNVSIAAKRGKPDEDLTKGHSMMADQDARESQEKFIGIAESKYDLLREILRNSAEEQDRAIAAYIIGYSKDKRKAVPDLQYAMQDADPTVRDNAMRALSAIVVLSTLEPDLGIKVSPTWFVEMLNSSWFRDRNKAASALVSFTEKREEHLMKFLRERAVPALTEMSAWKSLPHSLPAFILLGRIAGLQEHEIQDLWKGGDRQTLLKKVKESAKSSN